MTMDKLESGNTAFVNGDYEAAFDFYQQAAEAGDAEAQYKLGKCYSNGHGVECSGRLAAEWYQKAAAQSHVKALCALGKFYYLNGKYSLAAECYAKCNNLGGLEGDYDNINRYKDALMMSSFSTNESSPIITEPASEPESESAPTNTSRIIPLRPQKTEVIKYPDVQRDRMPLILGVVIFVVIVILSILFYIKHTVTPLTGIENLSSTEAHYNQMVTFSIVPKEGYDFDYVTINGENNGKDTMFRMPFRNVELEAHYTKKPEYKIEYDEKSIASISFNSAYEGKSIAFKIKPKSGYELDHIELLNINDSSVTNIDKDTSFVMPSHDIKVSAFYKKYIPEIEMVFVKGGTFKMGTDDFFDRAYPVHKVTLDDFYIGKYEVTQALWKAVMDYNPSLHINDSVPVSRIKSWNEIQKFIEKLNEYTGDNYRLPTEAEWEYAARGGNKSKNYKYSGSNDIGKVAWYGGNSNDKLHKIGMKQPNELGIYDMSGNVLEWCMDYMDPDYYKKTPENNPLCETTNYIADMGTYQSKSYVLRGGCYSSLYSQNNCLVYNRNVCGVPDGSNADVVLGLRLVKDGHNFNKK